MSPLPLFFPSSLSLPFISLTRASPLLPHSDGNINYESFVRTILSQ